MKAPLALAAALTLLGAVHAQSQPLRTQEPPPGSYLRSCRSIELRGEGRDAVLIADCRDTRDRWRTSTLRIGDCRDDISNRDGALVCGGDRPYGASGYGGQDYDRQGYGGQDTAVRGYDRQGAGSVTLFSGPNFQGQGFSTAREYSNLPRQDNDRALSLRIDRGAWEVCADANFAGRCQVFSRDVPDLRAYGMGEAISSLRPALGDRDRRPDQGSWGRGRAITLFYGPGFQGPSFVVTDEVTNLRRQDNDKAFSLRIDRGAWEVCTDSDFGGRCEVVSRDVRDLRALGLGGSISSIRPVR